MLQPAARLLAARASSGFRECLALSVSVVRFEQRVAMCRFLGYAAPKYPDIGKMSTLYRPFWGLCGDYFAWRACLEGMFRL